MNEGTSEALAFDPTEALRQLSSDDVLFVVIGGVAGRFWGSSISTMDLDVCCERSQPNMDRLADIDDLIRMKLAAGRPKDLIAVETLKAVREEHGRTGPLRGRDED